MAVNKVVLKSIGTVIDLTKDTISESDVPEGIVFHLPSGVKTVGTATEQYIYKDANGYLQISSTLPDKNALNIIAIIPRAEICISSLTDSNGNVLVDSDGNEIISVERS